MKSILLSGSLLLATLAWGQSDKHTPVPGTQLSLVPPAGFSLSNRFAGFQHEKSGASIVVTELPAPLQATTEGFTAEALQAKGMVLVDKQAIDFAGGKALFLKVSQQAQGQTFLKQILLFGDSRKTVMVNGVYPEASKTLEIEIRAALVSASYLEGQNADPQEAVPFRIHVEGTPFRFARSVTGSLLYSTDGEVPTKAADKAVVLVASAKAAVAPAARKQFSLDRLKKLPRGNAVSTKSVTPITVARLSGYEIVGEGRDTGNNKQLVYQAVLFDESGGYYLLVGTAIHNEEANLAHFRTITKGFQLK